MNWIAFLGAAAAKPPTWVPKWVLKIWIEHALALRIGLGVLIGATIVYVIARILMSLGRRGRRALFWGLTVVGALMIVGFSVWARLLPERAGSAFVLGHELVRAGPAAGAIICVGGLLGLALPLAFDWFERLGFVPFMAARHVRSSKSGFLTVISLLSMGGVGVSAFALCAVISIMGGFGADLKRKILDHNAHIKIESPTVGGFGDFEPLIAKVRKVPGVIAATPVVGGEAMASSSSNTAGVLVRGIDPSTISKVIELEKNLEVGSFDLLKHPKKLLDLPEDTVIDIGAEGQLYRRGPKLSKNLNLPEDLRRGDDDEPVYPGLLIGRELKRSLHVLVGDEVTLISPFGDLGPMGVLPRSRKFRVAGIFYTGMYDYDANHAYTTLETAQEFLELKGRVTGIEIKVRNAEAVEPIADRVKAVVGISELKVRHWKELNKNLFSALKLEKLATFIILGIAIAVASFCIICTLLLMVTEKSKEIAILKAVGASDERILWVFMLEGMIIGSIGTVIGIIAAWISMWSLEHSGVRLDPEVYYVDRLPILVDAVDYALVALASFIITTLSTVYPALAASRLRPVEGIRYE